jgi:hypothetical protein
VPASVMGGFFTGTLAGPVTIACSCICWLGLRATGGITALCASDAGGLIEGIAGDGCDDGWAL